MQKCEERKTRAQKLDRVLKKLFPKATCALHFTNPWELVVAVQLSAQCTDKMVNTITPVLFRKYRKLGDYVDADPRTFEQDIKKSGFYRAKTNNILRAATMVKEHFNGKVPRTMQEILTLPGVARKTANVVLGNAYGVVEGIAVDTHVKRFAQKFNLTDHNDPLKIEQDLMRLFPKKEWFAVTYRIIEYGRQICPARVHECKEHPLSKVYSPAAKKWPKAK